MGKERQKRKELRQLLSPLTRFWRHDGRRYCAIALCASLIAGNIGHLAAAASEDPDYKFELDRVALYEALQQAVADGNTVDGDFEFAGLEADTYEISMAADGSLYELSPEIEDNKGKLNLRVFARLGEDIDLVDDVSEGIGNETSSYEIDGSEEFYFLLTNTSDQEQTAVIRVGEKETDLISVVPYSDVEVSEPEGKAAVNALSDGVQAGAAGTQEVGPGVTNTESTGEISTGTVTAGGSGSSGGGSGSGGGGGSSGGSTVKNDTAVDIEISTEAATQPEIETETEVKVEETEAVVPETEVNVPETEIPETEVGSTESAKSEAPVESEDSTEIENETPKTDADVTIDMEGAGTEITEETDVSVVEEEKTEDAAADTDITEDTVNDTDDQGGTVDEVNSSNDDVSTNDAADTDNEEAVSDGNDSSDAVSVDVASISLHKTYRVASSKATPSDATPSDATPSDASASDMALETLDGTVLNAVRLGNESVVAFVTTAEDLGLVNLTIEYTYSLPDEKGTVYAVAEPGVIPDEAEFRVIEIETGSDTYVEVENILSEDVETKDKEYHGMLAFDIGFWLGDEEVTLEDGTVRVRIELDSSTLPEDVDTESLALQHLKEEDDGSVAVETLADNTNSDIANVEVNTATETISADFEVDSFSYFTITYNNFRTKKVFIVDVDEKPIPGGEEDLFDYEFDSSATAGWSELVPPPVEGYEYKHTKIGNEIVTGSVYIRYYRLSWQYSTDSRVGVPINSNQDIYLVYEETGPSVEISQNVSGDTVSLTANTKNFTIAPDITWSIMGDTDAVDFDPTTGTVTWIKDAEEGATVTVTVVAKASDGDKEETATDSIKLKNIFVSVTYDPNASRQGSGTKLVKKYRIGETVTIVDNTITKFANTVYPVFAGWATSDEVEGADEESKVVYTPGQQFVIEKDLYLYAQWATTNATANHMDIRIEGVTFTRNVIITDAEGKKIRTVSQTFTGRVTNVRSASLTGVNGWSYSYSKYQTKNAYEFRLGDFDSRQRLSNIKTVTAIVDITGDDGTVLTKQEVVFTQEQILTAWANCGNSGNGKGLDFNITGSNIELETIRIPARLIVTKKFEGLDENLISQLSAFKIVTAGQTLKLTDAAERTVTIEGKNVQIVKALQDDGSYMWAMTNLPAGTYTVTESCDAFVNEYEFRKSTYVVSSYGDEGSTNSGEGTSTVVGLGDGDVKVVAFTNTYKRKVNDLEIIKSAEDEVGNNLQASNVVYSFTVTAPTALESTYKLEYQGATNDSSNPTTISFDTNNQATVDIKGAGKVTIKDLPYGSYTVTENTPNGEIAGYYFKNNTITGNPATVSESKAGQVTVKNIYANYKAVTVTKEIKGNMADITKEFKFTLTGVDGNGRLLDFTATPSPYTFKDGNGMDVPIENEEDGKFSFILGDGDSLKIYGFKATDKVVINEIGRVGYDTCYEYKVGETGELEKSETIDESVTGPVSTAQLVVSDDINIKFINTNNDTVDTGILLDSMPYILILAAAIAGTAFYFIRKKKEDEDDFE